MSSHKLNESAMLHIKNLLNMVPGISAQKVKNSLESQGFKNVPCRQTIYTIIKEMNVNEVSVESEINYNYQEISAYRFDFKSIGANDIGHIIINLETQRSQNTGCFLKFNKNESNLFALKGRRYVLNSTKRNLSEFICTSCRHLYTNDIKNKDLNCNTSKKDCVSTFLADGTFSLENMQITKHHKNCSDIKAS
uniref:Transposase n=1 Tax=Strongyloides papillosus TaxID=174720 RepID=A0A0N5B4M3_STREA